VLGLIDPLLVGQGGGVTKRSYLSAWKVFDASKQVHIRAIKRKKPPLVAVAFKN
jgi:hypothetical protein